MPRTLLTGMSGVGKSSTIARLAALGYRAVDLDNAEWSQWVPDTSDYAEPGSDRPRDWSWRTDEVRALLSGSEPDQLFVAGTSTQQAQLYPLLEHVILLTVPEPTARDRLAHRTTNDYGKDPDELRRELELRAVVEPLLRRSACLEIDTSRQSVQAVAATVVEHVCAGAHGR